MIDWLKQVSNYCLSCHTLVGDRDAFCPKCGCKTHKHQSLLVTQKTFDTASPVGLHSQRESATAVSRLDGHLMSKHGLRAIVRILDIEIAKGIHNEKPYSEINVGFSGSITEKIGKHLLDAGIDVSAGAGSYCFGSIEFSSNSSLDVPAEIAHQCIGLLSVWVAENHIISDLEPNSVQFQLQLHLPVTDFPDFAALSNHAFRIEPVFHERGGKLTTTKSISDEVMYFYIQRAYFSPIRPDPDKTVS